MGLLFLRDHNCIFEFLGISEATMNQESPEMTFPLQVSTSSNLFIKNSPKTKSQGVERSEKEIIKNDNINHRNQQPFLENIEEMQEIEPKFDNKIGESRIRILNFEKNEVDIFIQLRRPTEMELEISNKNINAQHFIELEESLLRKGLVEDNPRKPDEIENIKDIDAEISSNIFGHVRYLQVENDVENNQIDQAGVDNQIPQEDTNQPTNGDESGTLDQEISTNTQTGSQEQEATEEVPTTSQDGETIEEPSAVQEGENTPPTSSTNTTNNTNGSSLPNITSKTTTKTLELLADGESHILDLAICDIIELPSNYHKIQINVQSTSNIKKIMTSSYKISLCQSLQAFECPLNSQGCSIQNIFKDQELTYIFGSCVSKEYLYVSLEDTTQKGRLVLSSSPVNNASCLSPNQTDLEIMCASESIQTCKNNDPCLHDCVWASCGTKDQDLTNEIFGSCMPWNATYQRVQEICNSHSNCIEYYSASEDNRSVKFPMCSGDRWAIQHHVAVLEIVFMVTGFFVLGFLFIVCYYRHQLSKYRIAPFRPPSCCPNCLFPRPENEFDGLSIRAMEMGYRRASNY